MTLLYVSLFTGSIHTDSYLNFELDHPLSTTLGVASSVYMYLRGHNVTKDYDALQSELKDRVLGFSVKLKNTIPRNAYAGL